MGKNDIISIDKVEYQKWLQNLCDEIDRQRLKAVMQLNASTLQHYWWLGNDILKKQEAQGWGAKVIDMLSADLMARYGSDSGYSIRNLKYMRQFAVEYPDFPFVQVPLAQITWYHHISMFPKVKDNILRAFYITESALQGWSRDIMLMQIDDGYHKKVKSLPNNFADTLPPIKSDLAKAAFKDPYNFGFVDMIKIKQESDLENQLTSKITEFLLELGTGFSFVKRQFPLNIDGDESRVDLLMYHTRLHCYVAIELKVVEFQPEFISKLNYYISAIDDLVKMPEDNPTIGLLLCRSKNKTKVEYALRGMTQSLGVAAYKTKEFIENLKLSLPSIDDLEKTLNE